MADKIHASSEWLEKCARELEGIENAINKANRTLASVNLRRDEGGNLQTSLSCSLRMSGARFSANNADDDIRQLERAASALTGATASFRGGVVKAARIFEKAERGATQLMRGTGTSDDSKDSKAKASGFGTAMALSAAGTPEQDEDKTAKTRQVVGKGGVVGKTVSTIWGFIEDLKNGKFTKKPTELIKYLINGKGIVNAWSSLHKRYKQLSNLGKSYSNKLKYKEMLGLRKYWHGGNDSNYRLSNAKGWFARFEGNFKKAFKNTASNTTTWFLAGISSAYNNLTQHWEGLKTGAVTIDRVAVEWAGETVTTVLVGAAATATAAAVFTGAPVVLIGVAAVGVEWAADALFKKITGSDKSFAEAVGDGMGVIYDDVLKPAAKKVGKKIKEGFNKAKKWLKSKVSCKWRSIFA